MLAYIATQKYVDALPLYRQVEILSASVLRWIAALASWMVKCGQLVQPLINLIHEKILEQDFLHMDETQVQVLSEPERNRTKQQLHVGVTQHATYSICCAVRYEPTRSGDAAKELLHNFSGALMVDGYEVIMRPALKMVLLV